MQNLNLKDKRKLNDCQAHTGQSFQDLDGRSQQSQQLELFPVLNKNQKPQISSIPGVSPRERNRYRVVLGKRILGDRLTLDQALQLAGNTNTLSSSNNLKLR